MKSKICAIIGLAALLSSCGAIGNKTIFRAPESGVVALSGKIIAKEGHASTKVKYVKNNPKQIEIQQPGYKTQYKIWTATKSNRWAIAEFGVPFVGGLYGKSAKGKPFLRALSSFSAFFVFSAYDKIGAPKIAPKYLQFDLTRLPKFDTIMSSISVERLYLDTNNIKTSAFWYKNFKNYKKRAVIDSSSTNYFNSFSEGWALDKMNDFCNYLELYDPEELNLSKYRDYNIYAKLVDYRVNYIYLDKINTGKFMELAIEYTIKNGCGETVHIENISSKSGQFLIAYSNDYVFNDAVDYSLTKLLSNPKVSRLIENKSSCTENYTLDEQSTYKERLSYEEISAKCFNIKTPYGTGVGIPVGKNGLVAVSHRILDLADTLELFHPDVSKKYNAEVVKESLIKDFAILKIDTLFDQVFDLGSLSVDKSEAERNVLAVGYTSTLEAFSVTDGILNVSRSEQDYPLQQLDIDASIMFYPAVFDKDMRLLGFIATSLKSHNVEGISFMRPIIKP
jgi:hypothetical protein